MGRGHLLAKRRQARGLFWGAALMLVGAWFLLERLGFNMPRMDELWPVFPLLFGLAFLTFFFTRTDPDPGIVWPGTSGLLVGIFFLLFTFEVFDWEDMSELWPVFPLIAGTSFFATWMAGRFKEQGLLLPGSMAVATGVIGLFFTLGDMSFERVKVLGAVVLVAVGLTIVVKSLRGRA